MSYPPKFPTEQYRQDLIWLKAFRDCGWSGKRAIAAAEAALSEYIQNTKRTKR